MLRVGKGEGKGREGLRVKQMGRGRIKGESYEWEKGEGGVKGKG